MNRLSAAVLGATGVVGQQYVQMLASHQIFKLVCVTGRESVGRRYGDAARTRLNPQLPKSILELEVKETNPSHVDADIVFSPLPTEAAKEVEPKFARSGLALVSDAGAHRMEEDVPLVIPEVNPDHLDLIEVQRRRRGWKGFIATTPNCTAAGLALVLKPLHDAFTLRRVFVSTLQAVSGAGYPGVPSLDIVDNVIPFIPGEEDKVEAETLKILGHVGHGSVNPADFRVSATCHRVPTIDGHMESLYIETREKISLDEAVEALRNFRGIPQKLRLPTAPEKPILVSEENDRPQTRLDRMAGTVPGMSVTVGRVRQGLDKRSLKLTLLVHNTIRGAAGSTILVAELLAARGNLGGS